MSEGSKDHLPSPDPGRAEQREMPAGFLRFPSSWEQMTLPCSALIKLSLEADETALELSFVTHRVTITGGNRIEIFKAVVEAEARLVSVVTENFAEELDCGSTRRWSGKFRTSRWMPSNASPGE